MKKKNQILNPWTLVFHSNILSAMPSKAEKPKDSSKELFMCNHVMVVHTLGLLWEFTKLPVMWGRGGNNAKRLTFLCIEFAGT